MRILVFGILLFCSPLFAGEVFQCERVQTVTGLPPVLVNSATPVKPGRWGVQVMAGTDRQHLQSVANGFKNAMLVKRKNNLYAVHVGSFSTANGARGTLQGLKDHYPDAFVARR